MVILLLILFTDSVEIYVVLIFCFLSCLFVSLQLCIYYVYFKTSKLNNFLHVTNRGKAMSPHRINTPTNEVPQASILLLIDSATLSYALLPYGASYDTGVLKEILQILQTTSYFSIVHVPKNSNIGQTGNNITKSLFFSKVKTISNKKIKTIIQRSILKQINYQKAFKTTQVKSNKYSIMYQLSNVKCVPKHSSNVLLEHQKFKSTATGLLYRFSKHHRRTWVLLNENG